MFDPVSLDIDRFYRLTHSADPLVLTPWEFILKAPGRWDDPNGEYRVLCTCNTPVGAYVEVLSRLKPHTPSYAAFRDFPEDSSSFPPDPEPTLEDAASEKLQRHYFAVIGPASDSDVLVDVSASRRDLETILAVSHLKLGDFTSSDYQIPQRTSRAVYDAAHEKYCGLIAPSAEHKPSNTFNFFESGEETNTLRAHLRPLEITPALGHTALIKDAVDYILHS